MLILKDWQQREVHYYDLSSEYLLSFCDYEKMDHIKSDDLARWLEYVGMKEEEFDRIADHFRDPRVWSIDNKKWYKKTIWNTYESFGYVNLSDDQINLFNSKKQKINL